MLGLSTFAFGIFLLFAGIAFLVLLRKAARSIPQAHVGVITRFGKHRKTAQSGLQFMNPFVDKLARVIPVQNQTEALGFAAITEDQASVNFTSTIIYTVADYRDETIQLVAFKFVNENAFRTALNSAVEAAVREFVAGKKQAEVLGLRQDIVDHAKSTLDDQLASWGYELVDLTVNDISFDADVMKSMSRVVAAKNAQTAAEYEGQALLITRTKQAEAEGKALVIAAQNGAEAARLRGEGLAAQRSAIAKGLSESGELLSQSGLDMSILAFSLWTETLREVGLQGKSNTVFLDGGMNSFEDALRRTQGFLANPAETPAVSRSAAPAARTGKRADAVAAAAASTVETISDAAADVLGDAKDSATGKVWDVVDAIADGDRGRALEGIVDVAKDQVARKLPPAGWYPDPQAPGKQRYWDGLRWTISNG